MMTRYLKGILFQILIFGFGVGNLSAQVQEWEVEDTTNISDYNSFLKVIETTLQEYYKDYSNSLTNTDSIIEAFGYDYKYIPEFEDSIYCERLAEINKMSPFHLDCNEDVLKTVKFFAAKRRNFVSVVMGRSQLYFTMFEEKLAKHDLPLELKYLAVIESGLRPTVKSHAGALGLWQFMYPTGKMFGLDQNSYIDERMNPELATEAACMYLKKLHSLYDDWNMALAAYNAGPGNVNKAIRRSGGKTTYWEIRPYLPRETQGYVPNFIAAAYLMTYHAEHNIIPREAKIHDFEVDTVCLKAPLHMSVIDSLVKWPVEDIQALNPIYKTTFIPFTEKHACITIPTAYLDNWIAMEDSIYALDSLMYKTITVPSYSEPAIANSNTIPTHHVVKKGQTLSHIAGMYKTSVNNLMKMNNMRSTNLAIGQKLVVKVKPKAAPTPTKKAEEQNIAKTENKSEKDDKAERNKEEKVEEELLAENKTEEIVEKKQQKLYIVNPGDNLWRIARENDTTVEELQKLNPNIDSRDLKVGQKIVIR